METPLVSVSIITYNHFHFLREAIDSVLMQEVDFPYEIIIGDDCSDDGTQEIIREYEAKYPEKIFGIYHPRRYDEIPGRTNNMTNLYACRGKYIAMLDGDDYWTDREKLQMQVEFLEKNEEYALSFHDMLKTGVNTVVPHNFSTGYKSLFKSRGFQQRSLFRGWFNPTSSVVFRNHLRTELPNWFRDVYSADLALHLITTENGMIYYHHRVMGVKRNHSDSFTMQYKNTHEGAAMRLNDAHLLIKAFPAMKWYNSLLKRKYAGYRGLAHAYVKKNAFKSFYYLMKAAFLYPFVRRENVTIRK